MYVCVCVSHHLVCLPPRRSGGGSGVGDRGGGAEGSGGQHSAQTHHNRQRGHSQGTLPR